MTSLEILSTENKNKTKKSKNTERKLKTERKQKTENRNERQKQRGQELVKEQISHLLVRSPSSLFRNGEEESAIEFFLCNLFIFLLSKP